MAMVFIYKSRVSATTWLNIWILKKTININIRNKVVNMKYFRFYRITKTINCGWRNKFCRYLVSFSFYIYNLYTYALYIFKLFLHVYICTYMSTCTYTCTPKMHHKQKPYQKLNGNTNLSFFWPKWASDLQCTLDRICFQFWT